MDPIVKPALFQIRRIFESFSLHWSSVDCQLLRKQLLHDIQPFSNRKSLRARSQGLKRSSLVCWLKTFCKRVLRITRLFHGIVPNLSLVLNWNLTCRWRDLYFCKRLQSISLKKEKVFNRISHIRTRKKVLTMYVCL